ncbi:MAG: Rrf2 family transcriptional regulator [Chloroflexi bacterium AL-W]|nr:Rrf2 family transcriptional regulator [Chloroflexi bacterium AL-N1]NOK66912.1 Rrf2 family transcriptional regulator [Chloroflexi bacterium AL-N10]NOK74796.1 Rrf2 family transcriptional regulator [Chloroflexi bacterium AL-N5]NOK81514.1 Rrf2 family transcriptional regulator [Chloroflexi bacterium AL-W]NOK88984.1 Rrf2 family transcriptional regulator [Chloroflexi bacterium AL-N15]
MRISSKGEYGLRALFDLAQRYGEGPIQSRDIHTRQGIDENYLNQILILLRKAGLIESLRGPQGGHRLARPPEKISILDALTALEGPLLPTDTLHDNLAPIDSTDRDLIREVWCETRDVLQHQLAGLTLEDLCQRKQQRKDELMYYI